MQYNALYGRQSLDVKDSLSVSMQIEKAKAMCDVGDLYKEYVDKGFSGKNTKRPGFLSLMQDIQDGIIRKVIVYKLDRFSRSVLDFCEAWEILEKHQVEFLSVNENFDTGTPMGKAMLLILMVFAQMERETISERVTDNYYTRAKYGSWLGGPAPYGMELSPIVGMKGENIKSLNYIATFERLQQCFTDYAENHYLSLGEIAKELTNEGIPAPRGKGWTSVTLARIFKNPVYVCADSEIYKYYKSRDVELLQTIDDFDGSHAGMLIGKRNSKTRQRTDMSGRKFTLANWQGKITSDIWLACQRKLANNKQLMRSGSGKNSWLSGIVKCGYCGRALVVSKYKDTRYFHCTGKRVGICSRDDTIYVDAIEVMVENELTKVIGRCTDEPYEEYLESNQKSKIELVKIEEEIANLIQFISSGQAAGAAAQQYVNKELERLHQKQCKYMEDEALQKVKIRKVVLQEINFSDLDLEQKKMVAATFLKKVLVYYEKSIELIWTI